MAVNNSATGIDAAAVTRIAGVAVGTLNVWINRNLIPGVTVGAQGRARFFDLETVLHIAIMVALVQLGYAAPFASRGAYLARDGSERLGAKLIIGPPRKLPGGRLGSSPTITFVEAHSPQDLDRVLDRFVDGRPESFTIVEVDRVAARVRKAFDDPDPLERIAQRAGIPIEEQG
jgi:hypothetical protein